MNVKEKLIIAKARTEDWARGVDVVWPDEMEWEIREQKRKELLKDYLKKEKQKDTAKNIKGIICGNTGKRKNTRNI